MPNRYVREDAIQSRRVNKLSWQAEVFYRRLINKVDDFGLYDADPVLLRANLFPRQLDKVSEADIIKLLDEVQDAGLLEVFSADGESFLMMFRWEKGRAKETKYPRPPNDLCERMKTYEYICKHKFSHVPDYDTDFDPDPESERGHPHSPAEEALEEELDEIEPKGRGHRSVPQGKTGKERLRTVWEFAKNEFSTLAEEDTDFLRKVVRDFTDYGETYEWKWPVWQPRLKKWIRDDLEKRNQK